MSLKKKSLKNVFVTGGAGYVGSHCAVSLFQNGYNPVILDNFSNSRLSAISNIEKIIKSKILFYKIDIRNKKKLNNIFKKHTCYAVIHCAGFKSVSESVSYPIKYFENNIGSTLSLLECMLNNKVFKIIFSSSATVYNDNQILPFKESGKIGKTQNPYGTSKFIIERILSDLSRKDVRWCIRIARYFNPISNHFSGILKESSKGMPNNLIPYIIKVAQKKLHILNIFGKNYKTHDGTCIRDYIHIMDLAEGHVALLNKKNFDNGLKVYNLGTGKGTSVLEVIKAFEKQIGITIPYKFTKRRKGDIAKSFCCTKKAYKDLKWKAKYDLERALLDIKVNLNKFIK
jgi:UDP-glucose 4-epimerase